MKTKILGASVLALAFGGLVLAGAIQAQPAVQDASRPTVSPEQTTPQVYNEGLPAMLKLAGDGKVRVIFTVSARMLSDREGITQVELFDLPAETLVGAQNTLMRSMKEIGVEEFKAIAGTPLVVGVVDAQQLRKLSASGQIGRMEEDQMSQLHLAQSTPLINAPSFWGGGVGTRGQNQIVAVLDTGVMAGHNFLAGKVVGEACFSTTGTLPSNVGPVIATALCADGSTAPGSAAPCTLTGPNIACWHGTHVAGIAVGKQNGGITYNGVAPEAKILAIQVFSKAVIPGPNGGTRLTALSSDVLQALAHVRTKKIAGMNIASVNMSLGGGSFTSHCSGTSGSPSSYETIMTQLSVLRVATVVSSGNDGFANAVSSPACTTSAITVGSTTKTDAMSPFSNSSSMIDVLAPGSAIMSSLSTNSVSTGSASGTSMAAPHVAGAYALLRQRYPCYPQSVLDNAIRTTGVTIAHPSNGQTYKRINLQAANTQLWPLRWVHACKVKPVGPGVHRPARRLPAEPVRP